MEIHLLRHTKVKDTDNVCYGVSDVALDENFLDEFQNIPIEKYDYVYTSPLERCVTLAKFITPNYIVDHRLIEMNFGSWELKNWNDISKEEFEHWEKDFINNRPPNGENVIDILKRLNDFLNDLSKKDTSKKVLIITHSGIIRLLTCQFKQIDFRDMFSFKVEFGSLNKFNI